MRKAWTGLAFVLVAATLAYPQKVSFKLTGGLAWINGDDYNKGIAGENRYLRDTSVSMSGTYKTLSDGLKFQVEVINYVSPSFAIGFGGGYFRMSTASKVTSRGLQEDILFDNESTFTTKVSVIPFFLNIHYLTRLGRHWKLDVFAGPVFDIVQFNFENPSATPTFSTTEKVTFTASIPALGLQGGVGLNYEISPAITLILDGFYRYGKVSNILGNWADSVSSPSGTTINSSAEYYLWYYENGSYPQIAFHDSQGPGGASVTGVRKADINISGLSVVAGVKFSI